MKKLENLGRKLSKEEQKNLSGGKFDGCSVTCSSGYYACCCEGSCECVPFNEKGHQCKAGGEGSSTCTYSWNQA